MFELLPGYKKSVRREIVGIGDQLKTTDPTCSLLKSYIKRLIGVDNHMISTEVLLGINNHVKVIFQRVANLHEPIRRSVDCCLGKI